MRACGDSALNVYRRFSYREGCSIKCARSPNISAAAPNHYCDGNGVGGASPSAKAFTSVRGSLGSPSAVAAFGHTMARHGIIVPRRRRRRLRGIVTATVSAGRPRTNTAGTQVPRRCASHRKRSVRRRRSRGARTLRWWIRNAVAEVRMDVERSSRAALSCDGVVGVVPV
jgi:hypothetical protein